MSIDFETGKYAMMHENSELLPELTQRQEEILDFIIRAYTQQPEPVSSKYLVDTYNLPYSSATVRNEMALLDELGYIKAPHTSSGRVPTAVGYRYFVKRLISNTDLPVSERNHITQRFDTLPAVLDQWMYQAAQVLARTSQSASLITPPRASTSRFKHVELISIQGRLILMVLVAYGGTVHQRMLTLADTFQQVRLSQIAQQLSVMLDGLTAAEVRMKSVHFPLLEREVTELAADLLEKSNTNQMRNIYREGLSEIINRFADSEGAQQAVRVFEERAFLNMILGEVLTPIINEDDDVQVLIAGEGRWEELNHLSLVLSRYGVPGQMTGALGVIGPTHINYGRAINAVRHVSGLMTDMLAEWYRNGDQPDQDNELPPQNPEIT